MKTALIILGLILGCVNARADRWADEVLEVHYGTGAGFGQSYFPENVLGPPDSSATHVVPSSSEEELLTLGEGGWIILAFVDNTIVDTAGPDLRVCENPFWVGGNPDNVWREYAELAVSEDGQLWSVFPWDSLSHTGLAGQVPVDGAANPEDPLAMGGDLFDLADLGMSEIRFVRLRDLNGDGLSFDLDAVGGVRDTQSTIVRRQQIVPSALSIAPNPVVGRLHYWSETALRSIRLYNLQGQQVVTLSPMGLAGWMDLSQLARGNYILVSENTAGVVATQKLLLLN